MLHEVACAGITLAVKEWATPPGEPPPIVALHGFTGSAETIAPACAGFERRRIVVPDLVGHGASDSPRGLRPYSMTACVDQVVHALDSLGVERCDLLGYSMGARVALSLTVAHRERVRNLALIGGTPGLERATERRSRREHDAELADFIEANGVPAFVDRWMALPLFASQARLGATALAAARDQRLQNDPTGLANSLRGMGTGAMPPLFDRLDALETPTWWIHGSEDPKFAAIAGSAAAAMANGQVAAIADAGHAAHLENPSAVAALLAIAFNPPRFPV